MELRVEKISNELERSKEHPPKKQMSMYSFFRLIGIFIFVGWGVMFFTVPLDLNEDFEWVQVIHVDRNMVGEFFLCLITVGFIYFGLVYFHFKKGGGRKPILISLLCLGIIDGILFYLTL